MEGKQRIVILDDNEIFASLLSAALEDELNVAVGLNGRQGLVLCLDGGAPAAVVVTDIGMPELDGIGMLKEFGKDPRKARIPVVVITATHFNRLSRDAVTRYPQVKRILSKSTSVEILAAEVKAVLRESGALPPGG